MLSVELFFVHLVEVLFFTGLVGCSAVVVLSWISILKSGFSDKDDVKTEDDIIPHQPTAYRFMQPDLAEQQIFAGPGAASPGQAVPR